MNIIVIFVLGGWCLTYSQAILCKKEQANTWIPVGPLTCYCKEVVIHTPIGDIVKYELKNCHRTTTTAMATTTTTTKRPNKCPSPLGKGTIDFRKGIPLNLFKDPEAEGLPNWKPSASGASVTQLKNSEASVYLSQDEFENIKLEGSFKASDDDDFMGVIFSMADQYNFYIFSWKRQAEFSKGYGNAFEGAAVQVIQSEDGQTTSDNLKKVLWTRNTTAAQGKTLWRNAIIWTPGVSYCFTLIHRPALGVIRITVRDATTLIFDSGIITDTTFSGGRIGAYCQFQPAEFKDFTYECN